MSQKNLFMGTMWIICAFILLVTSGYAQTDKEKNSGKLITIPVTVEADSERTRAIADKLLPQDFAITEDKHKQEIISVKKPTEAPIILAVLIQDDLVSHVGNEIKVIKEFIQRLPKGSLVMTGYITAGALKVTQPFTEDQAQAVDSLRIPISSASASPYSPYTELLDALKLFEGKPFGKRMVLLISDGLDLSQGFNGGSPLSSLYLDQSIREAQRSAIAVYSFYAPSVGLTTRNRLATMYGQDSLYHLAEQTGGEAYYSGRDFVTFDAYIKEFSELIKNQWVITYRSSATNDGFHKIEVSTDFDLHLNHPAGYYTK